MRIPVNPDREDSDVTASVAKYQFVASLAAKNELYFPEFLGVLFFLSWSQLCLLANATHSPFVRFREFFISKNNNDAISRKVNKCKHSFLFLSNNFLNKTKFQLSALLQPIKICGKGVKNNFWKTCFLICNYLIFCNNKKCICDHF